MIYNINLSNMKRNILSFVISLCMMTGCLAQRIWKEPAAINRPYYEDAFKVTAVEFKDTETIMHLYIKFPAHSDICFKSEAFLKADNGQSYPIKDVKTYDKNMTDIRLDQYFKIPDSGELNIALHFAPMPAGIRSFDFIEGYSKNAFRIWSITDPDVDNNNGLSNSNWRNEQSGEWEIGLYENCAVYDCQLWQYKVKKDKKVVLTDGHEDIVVSLGKEKNGKRNISINGKKQLYSRITSKYLPDYTTADETPFKTELTEGEAVINGWLKDWPEELLDTGKVFDAELYNVLTYSKNTYTAKIDSLGHFKIRIPLTGTQETYMDWRRSWIASVLEPGETYFLLIDKKSGCTLFMGKNARLQNERLAHHITGKYVNTDRNEELDNDKLIEYKNKWADAYRQNLETLRAETQKHPTLSKRYRDFYSELFKFRTCEEIMQLQFYANDRTLPSELLDYVDETAIISPEVPLSLNRDFNWYLYYLINYYCNKKNQNYQLWTPQRLLSLKNKGIEYSKTEHETIQQWQEMIDETKGLSKLTTDEERKNFAKKLNEKYAGLNKELSSILGRDDIQAIIDSQTPKPFQTEAAIIDSLFSDPTLRDICRSRELYKYIDRTHAPLKKDYLAIAEEIKYPAARKTILNAHNHYKKIAEESEKAVKASIRPSSDVEGLTDGKDILDKIVEPYKGKIVYLDIWGTWCSPCKENLKNSHKVKETLKDFDIVYLYLANRSPEESWKNIIAEYRLTAPNCVHYLLPEEQQKAVEKYVGLTGYPTYRLIDKKGNLHKLHWLHTDDMDSFLKTIETLNNQ